MTKQQEAWEVYSYNCTTTPAERDAFMAGWAAAVVVAQALIDAFNSECG